MKPCRNGEVGIFASSSTRASRRVAVITVRTSGPRESTRRSRASTEASLRPTSSSSSASSTSSSSRQPLRTVRRTSVEIISAIERLSTSSTETSVARRNASASSTLESSVSARPRASPLPCRSQ